MSIVRGHYMTLICNRCYPSPTHSAMQTWTQYQADADFACAHQEKKCLKPETRLVDKEEDGESIIIVAG